MDSRTEYLIIQNMKTMETLIKTITQKQQILFEEIKRLNKRIEKLENIDKYQGRTK